MLKSDFRKDKELELDSVGTIALESGTSSSKPTFCSDFNIKDTYIFVKPFRYHLICVYLEQVPKNWVSDACSKSSTAVTSYYVIIS